MPPYNANVPLATDLLSQSQADLRSNFQEINTFLTVNHEALNSAAPHAQGKHKQLEMPVQAATVATDVTQWAINVVNNALAAPAIWVTPPISAQHPAGTAYDITTATLANTGYATLPCGLKVKWGSNTIAGGNTNIVTAFAAAFPSACYVVLVSPATAFAGGDSRDYVISVTAKAAANFTVSRHAGYTGTAMTFYWLALGN